MPDTIEKGITIQFRGESVSFDNTVANINKSIQLLKNETARLNRELKLDPTNIDLIKQRFQALTQVQELSAKQLNTYREYLYEAMGAKGQANIEKNVAGFKELKERIANAEIQAEDLRKQMSGLVDANGIITNTEKWKALRAEQTKVNFELNSLTQELITAAQLTQNGITDRKKWDDTVRMVKSLSGSLEDAEKHLTTMSEKFLRLSETYQGLDQLQQKFQNISNTFSDISNATSKLSNDAKKRLSAAVDSAVAFEEAFAGIKKTLNVEDDFDFGPLEHEIRQIATELPVTAVELAKIGEIAGQLGIKADDLGRFTETMAKLGMATNLSANEAATAIARMLNITAKGNTENIERFAATLVDLGNNSATTEKEILELAERLASAGTLAGMSEAEILGMATAMSSLGLTAQSGGGAMATVIQNISKEIATNGKNLKDWAVVAGMSIEEFKAAWGTDAVGTLETVIAGLASTRGEGESVIAMLDELGIRNIRQIDVLQRLVTGEESLEKYVSMANQAWNNQDALENEVAKRMETVASKIKVIRNNFDELSLTLGEIFLPYIADFLDKAKEWTQRLSDLDQWQRNMIIGMGILATAISPITGAIASLTGENGIAGLIKKLKTFAGEEGFGGKIAKWVSGLGQLTGHISLLTTGLIGLAAILALAFIANEDVRNSLVEMWNVIKEKISPIISLLFGLLQDVWSFGVSLLSPLINSLISLGTELWGAITGIIEVVAALIGVLFGPDALGGVLTGLWELILKPLLDWLVGPLIDGLADLIGWISSIIGWVGKAIDKFKEFIGIKSKAGDINSLSTASIAAASGTRLVTPIASGGFGLNNATLGRLQMASGGNTLSLTTNINVNNNGTPIDESVVRRWGNVITDIVSDNLGKRW